MTCPDSRPVRGWCWCLVAAVMLAWNCLLASLASPYAILQHYDGVQYQLLARNRLKGHTELGDQFHTVHAEGSHPMWRPGLVWIEEGLARCLGSVRAAAAAASALGTTLLQVALLWLAYGAFGRKTFFLVLVSFAAPLVSTHFVTLAVGQGPEVWSATAIVAGLGGLAFALARPSWAGALLAGAVAGLAEWFRTGNLLLFAVPCAMYALAALYRRDRRGFALPVSALCSFVAVIGVGGLMTPSPLNKSVANLWVFLIEQEGPFVPGKIPDGTTGYYSMAGYRLEPRSHEITIDEIIRRSHGQSFPGFLREHAGTIFPAYLGRIGDALRSGLGGLRDRTGNLIVALFAAELLVCLARREPQVLHVLALAGGALAHYFGPVLLVCGDQPTHYLLVALPLFLLIAAQGMRRVLEWLRAVSSWHSEGQPAAPQPTPRWLVAALALVFLALSLPFYRSVWNTLSEFQAASAAQQAAVDALHLHGQRVACRNMAYFVDRDVETLLLPFAPVSDLADYVRSHGADGVLVWEEDPMPFFKAFPYTSWSEFDRAMQENALFGPPRVSGAWRWYRVRRPGYPDRANGGGPA
jgi:hypothetical protein